MIHRDVLSTGLALAKSGEWRRALEELRKGLAMCLEASESHSAKLFAQNIALICEQNGLVKEALDTYSIALAQDPRDTSLRYLYALCLAADERIDDALSEARLAKQAADAALDEDLRGACEALLLNLSDRVDRQQTSDGSALPGAIIVIMFLALLFSLIAPDVLHTGRAGLTPPRTTGESAP